MSIQLQPEFEDLLHPFRSNAVEFFLAASLYHARKISFALAAKMAGLSFESFQARLTEHFNKGFIIDDEIVLDDIATVQKLSEQ